MKYIIHLTQKQRLLELLKDYKPHRTDEIMEKVYGGSHCGLARVGARIWDLKQDGKEISGRKDPDNHALYWYQLKKPEIIREEFWAKVEKVATGQDLARLL